MGIGDTVEGEGSAQRLTARFAARPAAEQARDALVAEAGISREGVKITDAAGTVTGEAAGEEGRPGFMVTAHVPDAAVEAARRILGREGTVA